MAKGKVQFWYPSILLCPSNDQTQLGLSETKGCFTGFSFDPIFLFSTPSGSKSHWTSATTFRGTLIPYLVLNLWFMARYPRSLPVPVNSCATANYILNGSAQINIFYLKVAKHSNQCSQTSSVKRVVSFDVRQNFNSFKVLCHICVNIVFQIFIVAPRTMAILIPKQKWI